MNLTLEQKAGAHVLKVSGDIDLKGTAILRAGVTKLMKTGKDKIILDMSAAQGVHERFVQEITELHKLAAELLGKIVVAGASASITSAIRTIVNPTPFPVIGTVDEAIQFLLQTGQVIEEAPPELAAGFKARDARIQSLENQLALSSPDAIRKLRAENESLREITRQLETQITELITERRVPPDVEAVLERISALERNVKDMSASLGAGGHAKK